MKKPAKQTKVKAKQTAQDYLAQFERGGRDNVLNVRLSSTLKKGIVILALDDKLTISDIVNQIISPIVAERLAKK